MIETGCQLEIGWASYNTFCETVTELIVSHIRKSSRYVSRVRIDVASLKELLAEGYKIVNSSQYETMVNGVRICVDPDLSYREIVVETI
jgi:hypothetical protein